MPVDYDRKQRSTNFIPKLGSFLAPAPQQAYVYRLHRSSGPGPKEHKTALETTSDLLWQLWQFLQGQHHFLDEFLSQDARVCVCGDGIIHEQVFVHRQRSERVSMDVRNELLPRCVWITNSSVNFLLAQILLIFPDFIGHFRCGLYVMR